jgi:hypothetical protein
MQARQRQRRCRRLIGRQVYFWASRLERWALSGLKRERETHEGRCGVWPGWTLVTVRAAFAVAGHDTERELVI